MSSHFELNSCTLFRASNCHESCIRRHTSYMLMTTTLRSYTMTVPPKYILSAYHNMENCRCFSHFSQIYKIFQAEGSWSSNVPAFSNRSQENPHPNDQSPINCSNVQPCSMDVCDLDPLSNCLKAKNIWFIQLKMHCTFGLRFISKIIVTLHARLLAVSKGWNMRSIASSCYHSLWESQMFLFTFLEVGNTSFSFIITKVFLQVNNERSLNHSPTPKTVVKCS